MAAQISSFGPVLLNTTNNTRDPFAITVRAAYLSSVIVMSLKAK